jgi:hypothetical protein
LLGATSAHKKEIASPEMAMHTQTLILDPENGNNELMLQNKL